MSSTTPNTAANGGQILTAALVNEIASKYMGWVVGVGGWHDAMEAIAADLRGSLAAVPASEPVRLMNFGADGPAQWSGANNACDLTKSVTTTYSNSAQIVNAPAPMVPSSMREPEAVPAPVSGMPDLAGLTRYVCILRETRGMCSDELGAWVRFADVKALFAALQTPQEPDAPAPTKTMMKADPTALVALAVSGALPDVQAGGILRDIYAPVAATLPAAPAPTDSLISILEEISVTDLAYKQRDLATKALDILAAPAPTEQQDELPITRSTYGSLEACEAEQARRNAAATEQAGELPPLPIRLMDRLTELQRILQQGTVTIDKIHELGADGPAEEAWMLFYDEIIPLMRECASMNAAALAARKAPAEAPKERDNCQMCLGAKGGVKGNENAVNGVVMCDYCSALVGSAPDSRDAARYRIARLRPYLYGVANPTPDEFDVSIDAVIAQEKAQ